MKLKQNMANLTILLVLTIVACLGKSETDIQLPIQPTKSTTNISTTTTHAPNTTTTTLAPNTTTTTLAPNTTTTTLAPNTTTTTQAPNTTTTTQAPNTTTTIKPTSSPTPATTTTTSTVAPTTTPKPIPDPSTGKWNLNYTKSNVSCLLMDAALQVEILRGNETSEKYNVPIDAVTSGTCSDNENILKLNWTDNIMVVVFAKTNEKFELQSLDVTLNVKPDKDSIKLVHNKTEFPTLLNHSYKCAKVQTLNFTDGKSNETTGYLHISNVQIESFSNFTKHVFGEAIDCEASRVTSDVVPIVVGCVLAILVVVILIAYLFGRRRCQARGYLSM